ncbi:hypothetical protein D3C78_1367040 [compost metagenome]
MLAQAMQAMKDMGASKEVMVRFLVDIMMLDEEQAKLYAQIVDADLPGGDDGAV